jgi:hypothetical protein
MWNQDGADELINRIRLVDETISNCYNIAASNKSDFGQVNMTQNETERANVTEKKDAPKNSTMCKTEKARLREVHGEVRSKLSNYLDEIKESSDVFSDESIVKNGLTP